MQLSGLQIFKYLPGAKKLPEANCKKCGFPTCMAFALKVAKKQADITKCNHAPKELLDILQDALKMQQHEITFGPEKNIKTGGETVMFRHEKTFVNPTVIAITLDSDDIDFDNKLNKIKNYSIERVGEFFKVQAINLIDKGNIQNVAEKINSVGLGIILNTENSDSIETVRPYNPIVNSSSIKDKNTIVCATGKTLEEISKNSSKAKINNDNNIVLNLDTTNKSTNTVVEELTHIRRLAMIEKSEPFTYPVMTRIKEQNPIKASAIASLLLCRYSNIIVFDIFNEALLTTIFTLRQNIYTDPQKPLQVESKVYEVNEPDENAIVMMTTNFALTYFAVLSEVESSGLPTYIVITPSDGMSVLTAWSADKFTPEMAAKIVKESEALQKVKNKKIIIPGLLSHLKEELEEEIENWEIVVGPNEAYQLQDFVKNANY